MTCRWCEWLETARPVLYEERSFAVLVPDADHCAGSLTLVPKNHVPVLTELEPEIMADVLAGLSTLMLAVRQTYGLNDVEIRTHHSEVPGRGGHVHFHPILTNTSLTVAAKHDAEREVARVLTEANTHSRRR